VTTSTTVPPAWAPPGEVWIAVLAFKRGDKDARTVARTVWGSEEEATLYVDRHLPTFEWPGDAEPGDLRLGTVVPASTYVEMVGVNPVQQHVPHWNRARSAQVGHGKTVW
jgi:hypothetical protein